MVLRKRGFHKKRSNFFRNKLVLDSLKSKIAFVFIVFMFGVVISIGVLDVYGYRINLVSDLRENVNGDVEGVGMSPTDEVNNVIILKDDGTLISNEENYSYLNLENISKKFYESYGDYYDFISVFSNFPLINLQGHYSIQNNIYGIGLYMYNGTEYYGSDGRLLGINYLGNNLFRSDTYLEQGVHATLHETGHKWCCFVGGNLGIMRDGHWYSLLN